MNIKKIIYAILIILIMPSLCNAIEIGDVNMPDTIEVSQAQLLLNGAGVRKEFFVSLYVGGLYLKEKSLDPKKIIEEDKPMAIKMHIISSMIGSEAMAKSTRKGFVSASGKNYDLIKDQAEDFINILKEKINVSDIYDLIYIPGKGVEVYKNKEYKSLIEGLAFKQALFGIWLCDTPIQKSLKKAMLGK